jgi:ABC-type multidrug transport system fused ATPase/permease subunit
LNPSTGFTALTLFNLLRFPLGVFPWLISRLVTARASMRRIADFLQTKDVRGVGVDSAAAMRSRIRDSTRQSPQPHPQSPQSTSPQNKPQAQQQQQVVYREARWQPGYVAVRGLTVAWNPTLAEETEERDEANKNKENNKRNNSQSYTEMLCSRSCKTLLCFNSSDRARSLSKSMTTREDSLKYSLLSANEGSDDIEMQAHSPNTNESHQTAHYDCNDEERDKIVKGKDSRRLFNIFGSRRSQGYQRLNQGDVQMASLPPRTVYGTKSPVDFVSDADHNCKLEPVVVLDDVSIEVRPGSLAVIVGELN